MTEIFEGRPDVQALLEQANRDALLDELLEACHQAAAWQEAPLDGLAILDTLTHAVAVFLVAESEEGGPVDRDRWRRFARQLGRSLREVEHDLREPDAPA